jgi:hypothetical protein
LLKLRNLAGGNQDGPTRNIRSDQNHLRRMLHFHQSCSILLIAGCLQGLGSLVDQTEWDCLGNPQGSLKSRTEWDCLVHPQSSLKNRTE